MLRRNVTREAQFSLESWTGNIIFGPINQQFITNCEYFTKHKSLFSSVKRVLKDHSEPAVLSPTAVMRPSAVVAGQRNIKSVHGTYLRNKYWDSSKVDMVDKLDVCEEWFILDYNGTVRLHIVILQF